jgi:hypothetical protein
LSTIGPAGFDDGQAALLPGAAGWPAAVLLPKSGLSTGTADTFDHGCQAAKPCADERNSMNDRPLAGRSGPSPRPKSRLFAKLKSPLPKVLTFG